MLTNLSFAGGFVMGLVSSLHCIGMCGGISTAIVLSLDPDKGLARRIELTASAQAGRVLSYTLAGCLVGALGAGVLGHLDHPLLYRVLRSAAALALGWMGLSMTGLAPRIRPLDNAFLAISENMGKLQRRLPFGSRSAALLSGMAWGFVPCGMVYGALFFAMATGSPLAAARLMAGFGLGTVPLLAVGTIAAGSLRPLARHPGIQIAAGLLLVALAASTAMIRPETIAAMCGI
jgi:uncharacterized protein